MFAQDKNGHYAIVETLPSGKLRMYAKDLSKEWAQTNTKSEPSTTLQSLKDDGWTLLPDRDGVMRGDLVKDEDGTRRVLTAEGAGEYRTALLSEYDEHSVPLGTYTVAELKKFGYSLVMP